MRNCDHYRRRAMLYAERPNWTYSTPSNPLKSESHLDTALCTSYGPSTFRETWGQERQLLLESGFCELISLRCWFGRSWYRPDWKSPGSGAISAGRTRRMRHKPVRVHAFAGLRLFRHVHFQQK